MSVQIEGMDRLLRRLSALDSPNILREPVGRGTAMVQAAAKTLCPVDTGALRNSIVTSVKTEGTTVIGEVYTNYEIAPYIEFGTGKVGEASDSPGREGLGISYKQDGWTYTPDGGKTFVYTEGQPAVPFMYPALKDNERQVARYIQDEIRAALERV